MSNNNNNVSDTFSACLTQLKTGKNSSEEGSFPYAFVVLLIGIGFVGAYFTGGKGGALKWLVLGMGVTIIIFISYVMFIYDQEEFQVGTSAPVPIGEIYYTGTTTTPSQKKKKVIYEKTQPPKKYRRKTTTPAPK